MIGNIKKTCIRDVGCLHSKSYDGDG